MEGIAYYESRLGTMMIVSEDDRIVQISYLNGSPRPEQRTPVIIQCIEELESYFFHGRKFFDVEFALRGSPFQIKVWNELQTIPYGSTISYTDLALRLGDIDETRAAALAVSENPLAIVVPCHRVIGKDGDTTGYPEGSDRKLWLLQHEGAFSEQLKLF